MTTELADYRRHMETRPKVSFCFLLYSNAESIRNDPRWKSRENSLGLIELFSKNNVKFRFSPLKP